MLETWRQLIWLVPELDVGEIWPDNPLVRVDSWCSSQQIQKKTTDSDHLTSPKLITTSASILKRCSGIKVVQEPCDTGGGRASSQNGARLRNTVVPPHPLSPRPPTPDRHNKREPPRCSHSTTQHNKREGDAHCTLNMPLLRREEGITQCCW